MIILPIVINKQGENGNQSEEQWTLFGLPHAPEPPVPLRQDPEVGAVSHAPRFHG
jgi:hypothetical protein